MRIINNVKFFNFSNVVIDLTCYFIRQLLMWICVFSDSLFCFLVGIIELVCYFVSMVWLLIPFCNLWLSRSVGRYSFGQDNSMWHDHPAASWPPCCACQSGLSVLPSSVGCIYVILLKSGCFSTMQDSFYRGLTPEESERVHEYNFDHPGNA